MRNLKRALSLGLTAAMISGLMVMGSSAASYTDSDEIQNQAAVEILGEIGVMVGNADGTFAPDRDVTRAEMAVIITRILYGDNLNVDQFKGMNIFNDVPDWAEGFVNLCASLDIVAGVGEGKFDPNATVTTAQASLMLARALGYFQNSAEFGNDWALAAIRRATQTGIIGGDMVLKANDGLSRDNVAQMTFNTLTKAVPVQYNELLNVYYNENQGIIYSLEFNYLQTLGYKNFDLVYKSNDVTIYGRPATTWGTGSYNTQTAASTTQKTEDLTEDGGLIASKVRMLDKDEIITIANTPTYVYTEGTKDKDVYKDLGASVCKEVTDENKDGYIWTAYVNGSEVEADAYAPVKNSSDEYDYTGEGTVTEIYIDDADQTVDVIEINYYIGQVTKVKSDDDGEYITVKELSKGSSLDDKTFYVEGYAEDDYVVYTIDENEDGDAIIGEVFEPATVTGDVTRVENDTTTGTTYLRVDGTKYTYSEGAKADEDQQWHMVYDLDNINVLAHPTLNEEYVLYLDPNGYVVAYELNEEEASQYLYVKDSDEELKDWVAKVVLADGTSPKVDLKSKYKDGKNEVSINWLNDDRVGKSDVTNIDELIWKYTVSDAGVYTLTKVTTLKMDDAEIHNGKAYVTEGDNTFIVDKKTVFVDVDNNTAYTGYTEVPNVENAKLAYVLDERVAEIVFILDGDIYDENSTYFMLADTKRESLKYDGDNYWEYFNTYVNGDKQALIVAYDADKTETSGTVLDIAPVLYKALKTVDEQYITEVEKIDLAANTVNAVGDDAFWITTVEDKSVKFDVDDETVFVFVEAQYDKNGDFDKWTISEGDIRDMYVGEDDDGCFTYVNVLEKDEETAKLVYIVRKEAPKSDDTSVVISVKGETTALQADNTSATLNISAVQNAIDTPKFTATPLDEEAEVVDLKIDGKAWNGNKSGDPYTGTDTQRVITFTVVAENGDKTDYTVNVTIASGDET